jgi:hypothetical protein
MLREDDHSLGETKENDKNISVAIADSPAEIRTRYLPNIRLERALPLN